MHEIERALGHALEPAVMKAAAAEEAVSAIRNEARPIAAEGLVAGLHGKLGPMLSQELQAALRDRAALRCGAGLDASDEPSADG